MSATCPVCDRPQDAGLLCSACCDRLERDLGDVASIVADLDVTLSKQARIGNSSGSGGLARERTPINVGAMNVADDLQNTLTTWARDVEADVCPALLALCGVPCGCAGRNPSHRGVASSATASRILLSHIPEIRRHPAARELVDEISDAIAQARRVVDRPADRIYMGQCLMENPDEEGRQVTCLEELWARPGASEVKCRVCSTEHPVAERRAWMLQKMAPMLFTIKEASYMLGDVGNIKVTQASIRGYIKRGKIAYHTGTMIRLGDLLAVVVDEGERRTA